MKTELSGVPKRRTSLAARLVGAGIGRGAAPLLDRSRHHSGIPFDGDDWHEVRPHARSRWWGWVHYGSFLPSLPEPLRYLNTMTLIGMPGARIFDHDELAGPDARRLATLMTSTAAPGHHLIRGYDALDDCSFAEDGSRLTWGDELALGVRPGEVTLTGRYGAFDVDLELAVTPQASWFVHTPIYRHFSLLARATGTVAGQAVDTLGTFEWARSASLQSLRAAALPERLKLPADFFTYQVVNLDAERQLLLTDVRAAGQVLNRSAYLRTTDGTSRVLPHAVLEVLEYGDPLPDPQGNPMRMPLRQVWTVRDHGVGVVRIEGVIDSPWRSGHGRGYVAAFSFEGSAFGSAVGGTAYIEWVDLG